MIIDLIGGMVVGMIRFTYLKLSHPVAYGNVGHPDNPFNFTKTQPLQVQLKCFGNVVAVDLFPQFIHGKEVVARFTQIPLALFDDTAFNNNCVLTLGTGWNIHIYKFCINILI